MGHPPEIYAGGWHIASYDPRTTPATLRYLHSDWLGNVRARTDTNGVQVVSYKSLPFGDCLQQSGGIDCNGLVGLTPAHFTDQDRDTESGLDHFMFRQYSSVEGRWIRPDPAGLAAINPMNPQTWNQYAYVGNNAVNYVDPLGLCPAPGVYSKNCVYVQRIGNNFGCSVDGAPMDCQYAFSQMEHGAAYPSSTSDGDCYQISGDVFCGTIQGDPDHGYQFVGTKFDANAYITFLSQTLRPDGTSNCPPPFVCNPPPTTAFVKGPPGPPPVHPRQSFATCMTGELINNFIGDKNHAGITVAVHVAVVLIKQGAGSLLPGPGWLYTGTAIAWDVAMVGKSYVTCREELP